MRDRNGPWLSDRLRELGVELAHITICGDRPEDMEAQLRFMADQGVDLIVTSGGLGPTADDLTLEVVARFAGRPLALDEALERADRRDPRAADEALAQPRLRGRPRRQPQAGAGARRRHRDRAGRHGPGDGRAAARRPARRSWSCPARRASCTRCGPPAVATARFGTLSARATDYEQTMLRLFGIPESEIAETLRVGRGGIDGFDALEITTCLRRGEVEVVVRYEPAAAGGMGRARGADRRAPRRHAVLDRRLDGRRAGRRAARRRDDRRSPSRAPAGLLAARLTERPGSSEYVAGGVVAYSNEAKMELLGVDPALIERHGAVSAEVAEAMADGR